MSTLSKQNTWRIVCLISALAIIACIARMIPYGLAGDAGKVKLYFILMLPAITVSLASGVAYYYYHGKHQHEATDLDRMRIEAEILAQAGTKPVKTQPTEISHDKSEH